MRGRAAVFLAGAFLASLPSCGETPPEPEPPRAVALSVSPESVTLEAIGATAAFRATLVDQHGAAFPGTVDWSSDDPAVFTVAADGLVTAVANGSGTVRASFESLSATAGVTVEAGLRVAAERVASGLEAPLYLASPPGDPRLFLLEQPGRIRIVRDGRLLSEPFLDIRAKVSFRGERGLLGLAFDPDYAATGRFYVHYSDLDGRTVIERYTAPPAADRADAGSASRVIRASQPFSNHNGGQIDFGPDRMLYIALGDGGSAGDPLNHGQNPRSLLGTILRIDVLGAGEERYLIPPDNPFADGDGGRPEVWHYGLRNPWRFSFDARPAAGPPMIYIADVGQNRWEEINVEPADAGGLNFGWNVMEGLECFGGGSCDTDGMTLPKVVYGRADGCSVTGGYVYRGSALPDLAGRYLYADYCTGQIHFFELDASGTASVPERLPVGLSGQITSFGQDDEGELYVTVQHGEVYKLVSGG